MNALIWPILGVVGGCGGVGASTFASVLAAMAALGGRSVLVDLDHVAGGVDVLLGIESVPGARWSGLRLGGGRLHPEALVDGLPRWGGVAVLSADRPPDAAGAAQTLDVACRAGPVVVDLGRWDCPARALALQRCSLVVLVSGADVRAVTGACGVRRGLGDATAGLVVVRDRSALAVPAQVASLVGAPLIGSVPSLGRRGDAPLAAGSLPRSWMRVARGLLDAVDGTPARSARPRSDAHAAISAWAMSEVSQ